MPDRWRSKQRCGFAQRMDYQTIAGERRLRASGALRAGWGISPALRQYHRTCFSGWVIAPCAANPRSRELASRARLKYICVVFVSRSAVPCGGDGEELLRERAGREAGASPAVCSGGDPPAVAGCHAAPLPGAPVARIALSILRHDSRRVQASARRLALRVGSASALARGHRSRAGLVGERYRPQPAQAARAGGVSCRCCAWCGEFWPWLACS